LGEAAGLGMDQCKMR